MDDSKEKCDFVLNFTNMPSEAISLSLHTKKELIVSLQLMPVVIVVGVLLNAIFIFVVYRVGYMRTSTNMYLISLAISDSLFLITGFGRSFVKTMISPLRDAQPTGRPGCLLFKVLASASYFASLFVITLVILEKYYAVCKPMKLTGNQRIKRAVKNSIFAWIIGLLLGTVSFAPMCEVEYLGCIVWPDVNTYQHYPKTMPMLHSRFINYNVFTICCESIPFIFTLCLNAVIYARLIRALNMQVSIMEGRGQNIERSHHVRNLAVRMLVINGSVYFLLLAPQEISVVVWAMLRITNGDWQTIATFDSILNVAQYLIFVNSLVNPIIYFVTNQRYRQAYRIAFCGTITDAAHRNGRSTRVSTIQ